MSKRSKPSMLLLSFSIFSMLIMLLNACGISEPSGQQEINTPHKGGIWLDDLYEKPNSLIPNGSIETFARMVDQAIWAPLIYTDTDGSLKPGLLTVVPTVANGGASEDLKTWKFTLRSGLKWSDGQPLDARDVDFTWKLWMNPKFTPGTTSGINLISLTDISQDNLTITFHLRQAFVAFPTAWIDGLLAPMPRHVFQNIAPDKILTSSENLNPSVGSGPFKMLESKPGSYYIVSRNSNYYQAAQGLPYLDKIIFRVVTDQNTILKDLQRGTITSSWFLDVSKTIAYQQLSRTYQLISNPRTDSFEAMYFNFHNPILGNNVDVRRAIAMAVDHQRLIAVARHGQATPLCTDHGQAYNPGYQANAPCPKFDPTAAAALLQADGWIKDPTTGIRVKNGQRLEFHYSTTAGNSWRADDELILQTDLKKIGIQLDITNYPASTFFGPFLLSGIPGKFDIAEYQEALGADPDDYVVAACTQIPPAGSNIMFYCNHHLDALYAEEQSIGDPVARQQIFNKIHQIYLTDFPFITLYATTTIAMHKLTSHNYMPAPNGATETSTLWNWWCTNGQC